jgi:DNA polymerase-1
MVTIMSNRLQPATPEAMQLLMEGAQAFARMEQTGIRIDESYLDRAIQETKDSIFQMEEEIRQTREYKLWQKHYGNNMNLRSRPQLGHVMFRLCGHKRNPHMKDKKTFRDFNNESAFKHLDLPFTNLHFEIEHLKNALKRNLMGIKNEVVDGRIHPFFDLHTAESYRSSSSNPNFHNMPVRIKNIAQIVRTSVIPDDGCELLEADYGSQEVRVACCYNKDPRLKSYILGGGDMHKDMALKLYLLTKKQLGDTDNDAAAKMIRYAAKNLFVFAQFYGSYYAQCAPMLWEGIARLNLQRSDGMSLYDHLKKKGIESLGACDPDQDVLEGTYEDVVKRTENWMWGEVFTVYDQWKRDWWALYQRQGGVNTLTGFRMEGVFDRNQILCDPIQGSAFHCLLWSFIRIQREFRRRRMKSKIILQIHDSLLINAWKSEIPDVVEIVRRVAVDEIAREWRWITVPLAVEFDRAENNWFQKRKMQ